jgi:hypothetical protein
MIVVNGKRDVEMFALSNYRLILIYHRTDIGIIINQA